MTLSVVIPTLNEQDYIQDLLHDLSSQTLKPDEIIVVDGNSEDSTRAIASKFKKVKVYKSKRGVGLQRNIGIKKSRGEVIFFLDADTRLNKNFLEKFIRSFISQNLDIAVPFYMPYKSSLSINLVYIFFNFIFYLTQKFLPSGAGSCLIVKRSPLLEHGYFNPELTYDDIELIRRIAKVSPFAVIPQVISVSDRRFKKNGTLKMLALYLLLSIFFCLNLFKLANRIDYKFGNFSK